MKNRFIAFIPVRGGSKGISGKNIRSFCGQPLVYWVAKAANDSKKIDKVYVSTDSEEIKSIVEGFKLPKIEVVGRSKSVSTGVASTEAVMLEFSKKNNFENIVLIQATSPLLESHDLDKAIHKFEKGKFDSLLSLVKQKRFLWKRLSGERVEPMNYDYFKRPRRQDFDGFWVENGAFYITSREKLVKYKCRLFGKVGFYEMSEDSYHEIDNLEDWIVAENLKLKRIGDDVKNSHNLNKINLLVCDVDGVLTDGGMYFSENGERMKKFNTKDGKGIELIKKHGVKVMFLTSEKSEFARKRGEKLKVDYIYLGVQDKLGFLKNFFKDNKKYAFEKTAYIGDDLNDLGCLSEAYFSACPADAVAETKRVSSYLCAKGGGQGCAREVCDLIVNERE